MTLELESQQGFGIQKKGRRRLRVIRNVAVCVDQMEETRELSPP